MSPPPPTIERPRAGAASELARWASAVIVTVVLAAASFPLGVAAGAMDLAPVVFLVAIAVTLGGATFWRRALLPLSVVVMGLAGGVVVGAADGNPVSPSVGTLIVAPSAAHDLDGRTLHRGIGAVVVDLRQSRFVDGQTTHVTLGSDSSRVVVALPRGQCLAVRLHVVPKPRSKPLARLSDWTRTARLGTITTEDVVNNGAQVHPSLFSVNAPDDVAWLSGEGPADAGPQLDVPEDQSGFVGPDSERGRGYIGSAGYGGMQLYGRSLARWVPATAGQRDLDTRGRYDAARSARSSRGPVLDLRITGPGPMVVRDYPDDHASAAFADPYGAPVEWPFEEEVPTSPELRDARNLWPSAWTASRPSQALRDTWASWEQEAVVAMQRRARLAAGGCATDAARRDQWETVRYGGDTPEVPTARHDRLLAVNALGELWASPHSGELASGSPRSLAAATGTHLLDVSTARLRLRQYLASNLLEMPR